MYRYYSYGLRIHSEFPFPELVPDSEDLQSEDSLLSSDVYSDVHIELGKIDQAEVDSASKANDNSIFGRLRDTKLLGDFWIKDGNLIRIHPLPDINIDNIRPIILGPLISALLRQRGFLVLHASTVVIGEMAILFMGHSGAGKSTLVTTLNHQGYPLISDDVTAIRWNQLNDLPEVVTGYPYVRLLPDTAQHFGYDFNNLPLICPEALKRNKMLDKGFSHRVLPLQRMYVLEHSFDVKTWSEPIGQTNAAVDLIRYSRASHLLSSPHHLRTHLFQCVRLAQQLPICRLHRQKSLAHLPEVIALLESEAKISPANSIFHNPAQVLTPVSVFQV